jgi:hypothetical protein
MEVERVCDTCDNYLGPDDPTVCAVRGCDPETLSLYCNVGFLQTLEVADDEVKRRFKATEVPGQPEERPGGSEESGKGQGQVLRVPGLASAAPEEVVPEDTEAASDESLTQQRCLATTNSGRQCKRDALDGELFCGVLSHKKKVMKMIEDGKIEK